MKPKRKSNWMKGFVIPAASSELQRSQAESRAQIADKAKRNRSVGTVK